MGQENEDQEKRQTGMECLVEELRKRGATKQQASSAIVGMCVDILSQNGTLFEDIRREEEHLESIKRSIAYQEMRCSEIKREHERLKEMILPDKINEAVAQHEIFIRCNEYAKATADARKEAEEYINAFNESIKNCDTQEGRDALRAAQMFVNSVNVDTKYDNTAYIIGLASILSRGAVSPIEELKKINQSLFSHRTPKAGRE